MISTCPYFLESLPQETGNYQFRCDRKDDYATIWIDLDRDGAELNGGENLEVMVILLLLLLLCLRVKIINSQSLMARDGVVPELDHGSKHPRWIGRLLILVILLRTVCFLLLLMEISRVKLAPM